jgi:hypothetical protein
LCPANNKALLVSLGQKVMANGEGGGFSPVRGADLDEDIAYMPGNRVQLITSSSAIC